MWFSWIVDYSGVFIVKSKKKNKNELRLESGEEEGGDGLKDFDWIIKNL